MTQKFLPVSRAQAALPWLLVAVTCSPSWDLYMTFGQNLADNGWQLFGHIESTTWATQQGLPPHQEGMKEFQRFEKCLPCRVSPTDFILGVILELKVSVKQKSLKDVFNLGLLKTFQGFFNLKANTDIYIFLNSYYCSQ